MIRSESICVTWRRHFYFIRKRKLRDEVTIKDGSCQPEVKIRGICDTAKPVKRSYETEIRTSQRTVIEREELYDWNYCFTTATTISMSNILKPTSFSLLFFLKNFPLFSRTKRRWTTFSSRNVLISVISFSCWPTDRRNGLTTNWPVKEITGAHNEKKN